MTLRIVALLCALTALASAQPSAPPANDKADAKQLMQSGVKLLEAKDYLGALAIFKDGYARFPSAKFLLNIGTTLKLLDRKADAANAYQRYLDSPDADPQRRAEVGDALLDLDKWVGKLAVTCDPPDAEVEVGDEWLPAAQAKLVRVNPGAFTVRARREGYQPGERTGTAIGGQQVAVVLLLAPIPKPQPKEVIVTVPREELHAQVEPTGPRSRLGVLTMAHVSVSPAVGGAFLVGGTFDITDQLAIDAALLLGPGLVSSKNTTNGYMFDPPSVGGYGGASFAILPGQWRPRVSAGMLVFADGGARFTLRGAGGLEYVASRRLSFIVELGVEDNLGVRLSGEISSVAIVPALAATGRL